MKVGIISDTHDHVPRIQQAFALFKKQGVGAIVHCGDFCSPFMIPEMQCSVPVYAVLGNNDGDIYLLQEKSLEHDINLMGGFGELTLDNLEMAIYHGTYEGITNALITSDSYDVVISGHTHEYISQKQQATLVLNPGTAHGFGELGSAMILDTKNTDCTRLTLDADF